MKISLRKESAGYYSTFVSFGTQFRAASTTFSFLTYLSSQQALKQFRQRQHMFASGIFYRTSATSISPGKLRFEVTVQVPQVAL